MKEEKVKVTLYLNRDTIREGGSTFIYHLDSTPIISDTDVVTYICEYFSIARASFYPSEVDKVIIERVEI